MSKIIVIVGPTGVGKTKLSISLAKLLDGEIINGDSVQIYKKLNIGTAKIKEEEQENIPHHLIDYLELEEDFTVYDYQKLGRRIIKDIIARKKVPIIVGGTGLYIKALLYDYQFKKDNKRGNHLLYDVLFIGLTLEREKVYQIINKRVEKMIQEGLIKEGEELYQTNKKSKMLNTVIGYKELFKYFNKEIELEEAINLIKKNSRHYAKRQYTWFNNQMEVQWFKVNLDDFSKTIEEVITYINNSLDSFGC